MKSQPLFSDCFLNLYSTNTPPDTAMRVENAALVDRYVGEGEEPFYYSIRLRGACKKEEFDRLVSEEIALAKQRNRYFFEWKEYDIPALPFAPEILARKGFQLARESRLLFAPSRLAIAPSPGVEVKNVTDETEFEALLDVNELAFGSRSEWLNHGLRQEVREKPEAVRAYVAYVDGKPACSAWIKIYSKIGILFGGGTVPALRRKGAYRALVAARFHFAATAGAEFVMSECSPDSEKVLRALRFEDAGKACQWVHAIA